jgi:hypothetical protein
MTDGARRAFRIATVSAALVFVIAALAACFPLSQTGCNYVIMFDLHVTVVDATTGAPLASPTFTNLSSGQPVGKAQGDLVECETQADTGACAKWRVMAEEANAQAGIAVGGAGYQSQTVSVPSPGPGGRCSNSGDSPTTTIRLVH